MAGDDRDIPAKQRNHLRLAESDCLGLKLYRNLGLAIRGLVHFNLVLGGHLGPALA
ncbi:MAG: hypothetical protein L3K24_10375 [Gammaproteobacteria bacterium]|nr:hypothetical protein [Gammaproteobacteria bacterium]